MREIFINFFRNKSKLNFTADIFCIRNKMFSLSYYIVLLFCMTSSFFTYSKPKVLQALRYHFITRKEIKIMVILVNVFAIVAACFYYFKKVSAYAFLGSSCLWFSLMISFWYVLPNIIYRKSKTFKDRLKVSFEPQHLFIENEHGSRSWPWTRGCRVHGSAPTWNAA